MKKILYITAFPINNKTAGQNYSKQLIEKLGNNFKIDIIYCSYKEHLFYNFDNDNVKIIRKMKVNVLTKILGAIQCPIIHPFFTSRFNLKTYLHIIRIKNRYDYLYFDFSQVFIYGMIGCKVKKFFMAHDIILQKFSRKKVSFFHRKWIAFSEKLLLKNKNSTILCFSNKDKEILQKEYNLNSLKVDFFIEEEIQRIEVDRVENYFCFYGAWSRNENLEGLKWFEENIEKVPEKIKIKIVGGGIKEEYSKKLKEKGFEVLGFVDNPYIILAKSKGLIAPIFSGAGVKVKVIEALATGTPVIGTDVALEGIDISNEYIYEVKTVMDIFEGIKKFESITPEKKCNLKMVFNENYGKSKFINIIEGGDYYDNSINSNISQ